MLDVPAAAASALETLLDLRALLCALRPPLSWINNCVGAGNVRLFLAFLGLHVVLCLYGGLLLGFINKAIVEHEGLYSMRVRNRQTGELMPVTHAIVLKWLVHHHAPLVGLCISLTVIGLVLAGFFGYHLWLVARNTTTNESFKWTDLARQVDRLPLWRRGGHEALL